MAKSIDFASVLGLDSNQASKVNTAELRRTAIDYARTAMAIPSLCGNLRAELLLQCAKPATPSNAPAIPAVAQQFAWVHVPGTSAAVSYSPGMPIPVGAKVFVDGTWVDYIQPTAQQSPAIPAKKPFIAKELRFVNCNFTGQDGKELAQIQLSNDGLMPRGGRKPIAAEFLLAILDCDQELARSVAIEALRKANS